jgi:hypothetical protein
VVGRRKFGKKKRLAAPCASAEKRPVCLFPTVPTHHPSVFSYLLPQKFVEGVPKVMGHPSSIPDIRMENSKKPIYCILFEPNHLLGQLQIYKLATSIIKK